jgi:NitT/TauT family transport system permease protein
VTLRDAGERRAVRSARGHLARVGAGALGVAAALAAWWLAIELLVPASSMLGRFGPADGLATLGRLLGEGELTGHVVASLRRIVVGLALAAAAGIPLGLLLGSAPLAARTSGPVLGLLRMISPLSWTPIAIILFGVGDAPVVFLVAIGATWPIAINTAAGVTHLDPRWLRVARSLGASRAEALRHVVWPGIRPSVLTGLRVATGLAWVVLVPAEMLGVDSGLGYFILDARDRFAYDELVAAILVIGALGLALDTAARAAFSPRRSSGRGRVHATVGAGIRRLGAARPAAQVR